MASVRGVTGMAGYVASKHAALGLSRALAQEVGHSGFRMDMVAPGAVNTPMVAATLWEGHRDMEFRGAFKQLSKPKEITGAIVFFLGDKATSISGQLLEVNADGLKMCGGGDGSTL